MSASYVRSKTRQWAAEVATASTVPFHDTINIDITPTDILWFTITFVSEFNEGTFCDRGFIEEGFITITVVSAAGEGDTTAIAAMEQIIPKLMEKVDPSGRLAYEAYEPIQESTLGSADRDYRVSAIINYRHTL